MKIIISNIQIILIFIILIFVNSCTNKQNNKSICLKNIDKNSKIYQCHDSNLSDFSFLSKYKSLEALDLTSSGVKKISFLKDLKNLKVLLLIDTKISDISVLKNLKNLQELYLSKTNVSDISSLKSLKKLKILYVALNDNFQKKDIEIFTSNNKLSDEFRVMNMLNKDYLKVFTIYNSFLPSLFLKNEELDLFGYNLDDFQGLFQLKYLEVLKIFLENNDKLNEILNLKRIRELYITGNINRIDKLSDNFKKLYLYDIDLKDFSFLEKSNLSNLEIITRNYNSSLFKNVKAKYPNVKIEVKSLLFLPIKDEEYYSTLDIYDACENYKPEFDKLIIKNGELIVDYCEFKYGITIFYARENDFCSIYENDNVTYLKNLFENYNINFNALYDGKTLLDCAFNSKDDEFVKYLREKGVKRACEILKNKCEPIKRDK